ncbi:magnesium transporter [Myxococcota bacterium]|nr:magnesium transporter [Myxococcota bacterium]
MLTAGAAIWDWRPALGWGTPNAMADGDVGPGPVEQPLDPKEKEGFTAEELLEAWPLLSGPERVEGLQLLHRDEAEDFFFGLTPDEQSELVRSLPPSERRSWVRLLAPDDAADLIQAAKPEEREGLFALLDDTSKREVSALLAYAEDDAGGLMNPRYARLRPEMTVDEAISYLRRQARERLETIYYVYVLDAQQHLMGVLSFRELFAAPPEKRVAELMQTDLVVAEETMDQEKLSLLFTRHGLIAIPVVDAERRMKGIVTYDDIIDVVEEEATEDMHKAGGMAALEAPYLQSSLLEMVKKRAGWLAVLFLGEMLTASAMAHYEHEITKAVVLTLFIPLIISSGGNSGSQACTLVIRAMALEEIRLGDVFRVARREIVSGVMLGAILGVIGFGRILITGSLFDSYGEHYVLIGLAVGLSLVGIVLLGTIAGSMLPFLLRRLGLDPASASAPFVATLVDVTGLMLYFSIASVILGGTLL